MERNDITFYSIYRESEDELMARDLHHRISVIKARKGKHTAKDMLKAAEAELMRLRALDGGAECCADMLAVAERAVEDARGAVQRAEQRYQRVMHEQVDLTPTLRDGYRKECLHLSCCDCLRLMDCKFYNVPAGSVVLEGAKCGCIHYTTDGVTYPNDRKMDTAAE